MKKVTNLTQWLWFPVSLAYAFFAIVQWYFASHIEFVNLSEPFERYPVYTNSREMLQESLAKQHQVQENLRKRLANREISQIQFKDAYDSSMLICYGLVDTRERLNLNIAFTGIENVAKRFDTTAKANQKILRLAAISFGFAAVVSFVQGTLSL